MPRITWADLPLDVRAEVEGILGARVVSHASHPGGFSPGTADKVVLADGSAAFVKAVHPNLNPDSPTIHRAELRVMRGLPPGLPVPALLGGFERDGWVVLVLEYIAADHPTLPWRLDTMGPVVDVILGMSDRLSPSPLPLGRASDECAGMWGGFERCLAEPPDDLDPWVAERLPGLADRAAAGLSQLDGDTLAHLDLRADNLLVRPGAEPLAERVVVIDWPWALAGARWLDATFLVAELAAQGEDASTVATDALLERIAAHCDVPTRFPVDAMVGLASFFTWQCRQPDPPGLPTLRPFQRRLAQGMTSWMRGTRLSTW